jgi:hypothetical protein
MVSKRLREAYENGVLHQDGASSKRSSPSSNDSKGASRSTDSVSEWEVMGPEEHAALAAIGIGEDSFDEWVVCSCHRLPKQSVYLGHAGMSSHLSNADEGSARGPHVRRALANGQGQRR